MSIVAHSPSHRGEIAKLFILDAATLCTTLLRSVHSHYDLATTNALLWRPCYLGIVNLGASGQLQALFKCSLKVGVTLLDSRTNSEQFHSHVIEK